MYEILDKFKNIDELISDTELVRNIVGMLPVEMQRGLDLLDHNSIYTFMMYIRRQDERRDRRDMSRSDGRYSREELYW